jgi:hypothetical protein
MVKAVAVVILMVMIMNVVAVKAMSMAKSMSAVVVKATDTTIMLNQLKRMNAAVVTAVVKTKIKRIPQAAGFFLSDT